MKFNPQMLIQVMMNRNPNMYQQFQQFQQMMMSNPQMQQQYQQFRQGLEGNPQRQEEVFKEAMNKVSGNDARPNIGGTANNG